MNKHIFITLFTSSLLISGTANMLAEKTSNHTHVHTGSTATESVSAHNNAPKNADTATHSTKTKPDAHHAAQSIEKTDTIQKTSTLQKISPKKLTLMQRIQQHYKTFMAQSFMRKFVTGITVSAASIYAARTLFQPVNIEKERAKIREEEIIKLKKEEEIREGIRQEERRRIVEEEEIREGIRQEERLASIERNRLAEIERQTLEDNAKQNKAMIDEATRNILIEVNTLCGSSEKVKKYLSQGAPVNTRDNQGNTLLHSAAYKGNDLIVKTLLAHNATVNALNNNKQTPLVAAVAFYHLNPAWIIKQIDEREKTICTLISSDATRQSIIPALKIASHKKFPSLVPLLLKQAIPADIVTADNDDCPLLMLLATKHNHHTLIEALLTRRSDLLTTKNGGYTPLWSAVESGYTKIVEVLLKHGAKPTPSLLNLAVKENHIGIVELFINSGIDINELGSNHTPLMQAALHGHIEIAKLLLKHGANIYREDDEHRTALCYALTPPYEYRLNRISMTNLLLARGAQVNTGSPAIIDDWTPPTFPLRIAIGSSNLLTPQMLILAGADVHQTDDAGKSALTSADSDMLEAIKKAESIREQLEDPSYEIPTDMDERTKKLVKYELMHRRYKKQAAKNALKLLQENNTFTNFFFPPGIDGLICDYADLTLYDHAALDMQGQVAPALKISTITPNDILIRSELSALIYDYASEIDAQKSTKQSTTEGTAQNAQAMP